MPVGQDSAQTDQAPLLAGQVSVSVPAPPNPQSLDEETLLQLLKILGVQSAPMILRGAVVSARYLICAIMLGNINSNLLGPNTLINSLESLLIIFGGRSLAIVSSEISKLYGEIKKATQEKNSDGASAEIIEACDKKIAENTKKIGVVVRHGVLLAGTIGLPIAALYYFANHHILKLFGQTDFSVEKAQDYFQAAALGYIALNFLTAQQRLLQGLHDPMPVLASNTMHSTLSVVFSYLFLNGKWIFPKLEMDGVGYAFSIAGWTTVLANTVYLATKKNLYDYKLFSLQGGFQWDLYKDLAKKGLQTGLQNTTENIANMTSNIILGLHSATALAATQMSENLALLLSIMSGGLAQAISVCVGKALGEKKYNTLKRYGNIGILAGVGFPVIAFVAMLFAGQQYISSFIDTKNPKNAELVGFATSFLLFECLKQLMTSVQLTTATGGLLGLKNTAFTMKTSIVSSLGLNAIIQSVMHFGFHAGALPLFSAKAISGGITAFLDLGCWIVNSHEQSPAEKAAIKDRTLRERIERSVKLSFWCEPEEERSHADNGLQSALVPSGA